MADKMTRVEIYDLNESGVLAFDLVDVLRAIEPWRDLEWRVLELEATGELKNGKSITALETSIAESSHGLQFKWEELMSLALNITQTINATIVGLQPGSRPPVFPIQASEGLEIVVEAFDTTLWAVSTRLTEVVDRIRTTFTKTKVLESCF
jgi:hypothetical protein